jgi:Ca2+-binding EF-hand superfamily protein
MEEVRRALKIAAGNDLVGQKEYMQSLFRRWDPSGRGALTKNAFKQSITPLRARVRDSDIDEWFIQFGIPHSNQMDTQAFLNALCQRSVTANSTTLAVPAGAKLNAQQKEALVKEFRAAVARRGGLNGMQSLARAFRIYDTDGNMFLDRREFMSGLQNFGLNVSATTTDELMSCFDLNVDGKLNFTEFLRGIRGSMNAGRVALVNQAFDVLDSDGTGVATIADIQANYNAKSHPYVVDGRMTEAQVLQDFMRQWDGRDQDGKVTRAEFREYYENVSCSIDRDDYFELMIRNAWHMSGGTGWSENTANSRVLVTMPDGSQRVVEIKHDLGLDLKNVDEVNRRLRQQGEVGVYTGPGSREVKQQSSRGYIPAFGSNPSSPSAARLNRPPSRNSYGARAPNKGVPDSFTSTVVTQFRKVVLDHGGANGIRSLGSIFRRMDDNRSRSLSAEELQSGVADYGLNMSIQDCSVLLHALDRSNSGKVSFDDFLLAMRGTMNPKRVALVNDAFRLLDKDGSGIVTVHDVASAYDAKYHPDVMHGKKTPQQVFAEFMMQWETEGKVDGKVTLEEFTNYYQDVSASIDSDDYFELMMRNSWHMSGGTGQKENTSNLRVLVVFTDGRQEVIEVRNDLGLRRNDMRGIRTALRRQGVTNIAKIRLS